MATDPAFLLYSQDFLTGVSDLTMEERGQYITLLCLQHQKGPLTPKMIRLCVGNTSSDVLAKFEKNESGNLVNKRLEAEKEKRKKHSENQRINVLKRWNKVKSGNTTVSNPVIPLENENENRNENENTIDNEIWENEKLKFHNDWKFKEKFCRDKKIEMPALEQRLDEFISDLELKEEYKPVKELKRHFINLYNKKNGTGTHQQLSGVSTKTGTSSSRTAALKKW